MVKQNPIRRIISRVKLNRVQKVLLIGLLVLVSWVQIYALAQKGRAKMESREPEIAALVESNLKKIDPKALTDKGVIRSFRIDTDKSEYVAGGELLLIQVYINDNESYNASYLIRYDTLKSRYDISSFVFYDELDQLTKELRR